MTSGESPLPRAKLGRAVLQMSRMSHGLFRSGEPFSELFGQYSSTHAAADNDIFIKPNITELPHEIAVGCNFSILELVG